MLSSLFIFYHPPFVIHKPKHAACQFQKRFLFQTDIQRYKNQIFYPTFPSRKSINIIAASFLESCFCNAQYCCGFFCGCGRMISDGSWISRTNAGTIATPCPVLAIRSCAPRLFVCTILSGIKPKSRSRRAFNIFRELGPASSQLVTRYSFRRIDSTVQSA